MGWLLAALLALSPAQATQIDRVVTTVMHDQRIPGLSLGVARHGAIAYLRGYGLRDRSRALPVDGYTIFRVGSITKQFTAALVLQQVALRGLSLDSGPPPTIRELLDQTAGGQWQYRNENYASLGAILERAAGMPFCDLLRRRIVAPLRLRSTGCGFAPFAWNVALGRARDEKNETGLAPAAGGLVSNVPDILHWLDALDSGRVIPAPLFAAMATSGRLDGFPTHYGFGFFVRNWYGYRVLEHSGFTDGFSADDALVLDDGLAIAVLANRAETDLVPLTKSVAVIVDPPRDRNLVAQPNRPFENEDAAVTHALASMLVQRLPGRGAPQLLEFIERSSEAGETVDEYRVTYPELRLRAFVRYRRDNAIDALTVVPDNE